MYADDIMRYLVKPEILLSALVDLWIISHNKVIGCKQLLDYYYYYDKTTIMPIQLAAEVMPKYTIPPHAIMVVENMFRYFYLYYLTAQSVVIWALQTLYFGHKLCNINYLTLAFPSIQM